MSASSSSDAVAGGVALESSLPPHVVDVGALLAVLSSCPRRASTANTTSCCPPPNKKAKGDGPDQPPTTTSSSTKTPTAERSPPCVAAARAFIRHFLPPEHSGNAAAAAWDLQLTSSSLQRGYLTEVAGPAGSGKTQLLMQLCCYASRDLGKRVLVCTTTNAWEPRFLQFFGDGGGAASAALEDRVEIREAYCLADLARALRAACSCSSGRAPPDLVILDGLTLLIAGDPDCNVQASSEPVPTSAEQIMKQKAVLGAAQKKRAQKITSFARLMRTVPGLVFYTAHMAQAWHPENSLKVALGKVWESVPDRRIFMQHGGGGGRQEAAVDGSPRSPSPGRAEAENAEQDDEDEHGDLVTATQTRFCRRRREAATGREESTARARDHGEQHEQPPQDDNGLFLVAPKSSSSKSTSKAGGEGDGGGDGENRQDVGTFAFAATEQINLNLENEDRASTGPLAIAESTIASAAAVSVMMDEEMEVYTTTLRITTAGVEIVSSR